MTAEVIVALLGLAGTMLGFYIKRYWLSYDAKAKAEQRQTQEQAQNDAQTKQAADETARINASKMKQDKAAQDWANKTN